MGTTDVCRHDDSDPVGTYKCQTDCTQSGSTCYDGTAPPKSCCDSAEKCKPDSKDPTKFTCQGSCVDSGETCFDHTNPTLMESVTVQTLTQFVMLMETVPVEVTVLQKGNNALLLVVVEIHPPSSPAVTH